MGHIEPTRNLAGLGSSLSPRTSILMVALRTAVIALQMKSSSASPGCLTRTLHWLVS